jgi:mono/diheme cytochrome c family protein
VSRTPVIVAATLAAAAVAGVAAAWAIVFFGAYDVAAETQHTQPVHTLLETAMQRSVQARAAALVVPPARPGQRGRGAACFRTHCVQCHGAPGVAPGPVGMSLQPLPGPLHDAARRWRPQEIYWITRHGIRMSGMPAWGMRMSDADLWALVDFIGTLPTLMPPAYAAAVDSAGDCALPSGDSHADAPAGSDDRLRGDDGRARLALRQYGCSGCHRIPGVTGSDANVGPPLEGLARRRLIAGRLDNTPENLARWLRAPNAVKPGTAMPALGVSEEHARLMAAYLSRLY